MTEVHPCYEHRSIIRPDFPWERAVDIATDCPSCVVIHE